MIDININDIKESDVLTNVNALEKIIMVDLS